MITSRRSALLPFERKQVWEMVLDVDHYKRWRSDVSHTEKINEKQFIEYSTQGIPTTFTVTAVQPYQRWELDLENSNLKGHWVGIFTCKENQTEIDFTESVTVKKWFFTPFVKLFLKKQQAQFIADLEKALIA